MKSYLKLSLLLFGVLLFSAHCQEGQEVATDDQEEVEEFKHEDGEGDEDEDDGGMEKMDPLTPEQMKLLHKKIDANTNGKVSLAEVTDFAHQMRRELAKSELDDIMKQHDTNKDGKLTWTEFLGDAGEIPEEEQNEKHVHFKELDVNKDEALDMDELAQMYHHHTNEKVETELTNVAMKDKDTDKNGVLSLREFFQHLQIEGEDLVDIEEEDQKVFKDLDTDNSGTLTLKELKAWESGGYQAEEAAKKLFAMADKDKDNVLTLEEMNAIRHEVADHDDYEPQMYLTQWAEQHAQHGEL